MTVINSYKIVLGERSERRDRLSRSYTVDMGLLKTKSSLGLKLADVAWSTAVLAPLVVTYWRGTWDLLDDLVS